VLSTLTALLLSDHRWYASSRYYRRGQRQISTEMRVDDVVSAACVFR
jgi:hypothetical protein